MSSFDDELDDYPNIYSVYVLPESAQASLDKSSWKFLETVGLDPVGEIPVDAVKFDHSKRCELDPSCLDVVIQTLVD